MTEAATPAPAHNDHPDEMSEALRARILSAAESLFLSRGFHVATMDAIAREAGCSKKTIYKLVPSKEELFFRVLYRTKDEVLSIPIEANLPPEEALNRFVLQASCFILEPERIAVMRMALGEYTHSPELLRLAEKHGSDRARFVLETYLSQLDAQGDFDMGDPSEASRILMGMAIGAFHHELLVGMRSRITAAELRGRIEQSVRIFLAGTRRH